MAEQTQTRVVDDLDPTLPGEKRVVLGLNDVVVICDLSDPNYDRLVEFLRPYLTHGQQLPGVNLLREEVRRRIDPVRIRIWAKQHKLPINARGRIPQSVEDRYLAEEVDVKPAIKPRKRR